MEGRRMESEPIFRGDLVVLSSAPQQRPFGSGITERHDTVSITRSGKIIITRSGDKSNRTETVTFENYNVNGSTIAGTKTRVSAFVVSGSTAAGASTTSVTGGKITFSDGTVATWTSSKQRKSSITLDANKRPVDGNVTIEGETVVAAGESVIYSHAITKTITENVACRREHHGPVSGTVETHYKTDSIVIDFGDGSCGNSTISVSVNGTTTTKEVGE